MKNLLVLTAMIVSTVSFAKPSSSKPFYDTELKLKLLQVDKEANQAFIKIQKNIVTEYDVELASEYAKTQAKRKLMKEFAKSIKEAMGDLAKGPKASHPSSGDVANQSRTEDSASESQTQAQPTESSASESAGQ